MNEYFEMARKIKDTVSEYIPTKLSIIIKLAELAFDIFNKSDNNLRILYKNAFKEAIENIVRDEQVYNIRKLLNNCQDIQSFEDIQDLHRYLKDVNTEFNCSLSENDILRITDNIVEAFENVLLNEKYDKLYMFYLLCRIPNVLNGKLEELKNTLEEMYNRDCKIKTDNKSYAQDYIKPLFRHRNKPIITLKDVFIMPDIKINNHTYNALDVIRNFVNGNNQVLFIEGCGGYGKSSIVSFLAYNYMFNSSAPNISFLANKYLIIIRLRDIKKEDKIKDIYEKINNIYSLQENIILIFEGLDELCMVEKNNGANIANNIIKAFSYYNRKIIFTTRPTYINYNNINCLNIFYCISEICCFSKKQREQFTDAFSIKDKTHFEAVEYIKNLPLEKQKNESIYGSPFLLYIILSGGIKDEEKDNSWLLMHRLFHDELFNPPYSYDRGVNYETAENIYQFNCDIAYEMFKTKNQKLFMTTEELKKILPNNNITEMIEKSHGLFAYMRKSNNDGAIEFVHNHVRDYFLCEKVLREMNFWYTDSEIDSYKIALSLGELLNYDFFTDEVKLFIKEALQQNKTMEFSIYKNLSNKIGSRSISMIFDWFYKSGGLIQYNITNLNYRPYLELSYHTINNSAYIYKIICESKLQVNNFFYWVSEKVLKEYTTHSIFEMFKKELDRAFLVQVNLHCANLKEANFSGADLSKADLSEAVLYGANLNRTILFKTNLDNADLRNADLRGTDLRFSLNLPNAIFGNTKYNDITQFPKEFTVSEPNFKKV